LTATPSPEGFDQLCRELVEELNELRVQYRLAHSVAFLPQVVDSVSVSSGAPEHGIPHSQLLDHSWLRGKLAEAARSARGSLQGTKFRDGGIRHIGIEMAVDHLKSALLTDEKPHGPEFDPVLFPRTAAKEDLTDSIEAQRRRHERGVSDLPDDDTQARSSNDEPDIWTAYKRGDRQLPREGAG
jgi:hypothetical protein